MKLDPVCLVHGRRKSEHQCLFCCLCFTPLTPEQCNKLPDGTLEDVCQECAMNESDDFYDGFDKPLMVRAAPNGFISYEAYSKKASQVVNLKRRLADALLDVDCLHAKIAMIVARLGGTVEGLPTGPHNLLQRIDLLIREEILHAEHHKRGGTCRTITTVNNRSPY